MTTKEYIEKNAKYRKGIAGPEVSFTLPNGYGYSVCDCSGKTDRSTKAHLMSMLVDKVLASGFVYEGAKTANGNKKN